jgi:phosphoserine phosphatase RsbU/P
VGIATLIVTRKDQTTEHPIDPKGIIVGRSPGCQVVLESSRISRQHARIFQDPFGRWIIEDLDSSHGVIIAGQRIRAHAILPGEQMLLGPYSLSLRQPIEQVIAPDPTLTTTTTRLVEGETNIQVVRSGAARKEALPESRLRELNGISAHLESLTAPAELYPQVCRCLAVSPNTAALVARLPAAASAGSPRIIACHLGADHDTAASAENLCLSRRVLEAVRTSPDLVMAKSISDADAQMTLTIADASNPRAVLAAAIGEAGDGIDALYLDVPLPMAEGGYFDLIHAVVAQVRLVRKYLLLNEAKAQRHTLDYQLSLARNIQTKLMPAVPAIPGVDMAFHYEPALWVGGDYCDIWPLPGGRLAFAVGDVSGKGLPAAMVMSNLQAALRTATLFCPSPSEAMNQVNAHLHQHLPGGMFVTLFLGFFDPSSGKLEYVNAGHIPPLLVMPEANVTSLPEPPNTVLGITDDHLLAEIAQLVPGAVLVAVTDGITESQDPDGEMLGIEPIQQALSGPATRSSRELVDLVTQHAARFRASCPQQDDVTVLALRWQGTT